MNPSPIDFAPNSPISLPLLKEYYKNKKCLIKMNPNYHLNNLVILILLGNTLGIIQKH